MHRDFAEKHDMTMTYHHITWRCMWCVKLQGGSMVGFRHQNHLVVFRKSDFLLKYICYVKDIELKQLNCDFQYQYANSSLQGESPVFAQLNHHPDLFPPNPSLTSPLHDIVEPGKVCPTWQRILIGFPLPLLSLWRHIILTHYIPPPCNAVIKGRGHFMFFCKTSSQS